MGEKICQLCWVQESIPGHSGTVALKFQMSFCDRYGLKEFRSAQVLNRVKGLQALLLHGKMAQKIE